MGTTWEPLSWNGSGGLISAVKIEENCSRSKRFTLLSLFAVHRLKQSSSLRTDPILRRTLTPRCSRVLPLPLYPSTFSLSLALSVASPATSSWLSLLLFINKWQRWLWRRLSHRISQTPEWVKGLSLQEIWSIAVACESEFGLRSAHYAKRTFASFRQPWCLSAGAQTDVLWVLRHWCTEEVFPKWQITALNAQYCECKCAVTQECNNYLRMQNWERNGKHARWTRCWWV